MATWAIVGVVVLAAPALQAEIVWLDGALEPALLDASRHRRLVVVDFSASWCGPCQEMDALVWPRREVSDYVEQHYVALRVDADSPQGVALRGRYHVGALPTVLGLRSDGSEVDRLVGNADTATLRDALMAWDRGGTTLDVLEARVAQHPADWALRLDVGSRYADRGNETRARLHLDAVVTGDTHDAHGWASQALLALGDRLYLRALQDPARAAAALETLIQRFPTSAASADAAVPLALARHRLGHDTEALTALSDSLEHSLDDVRARRANDAAWMLFRERWDLARAERIARDGLQRSPRNAALVDTLAEIVFAQGRPPEAARLERDAIRFDPASPYYRRQLQRFLSSSSPPP